MRFWPSLCGYLFCVSLAVCNFEGVVRPCFFSQVCWRGLSGLCRLFKFTSSSVLRRLLPSDRVKLAGAPLEIAELADLPLACHTMSTSWPYHVVDAFTTQPFSGNPAAVVVLEQDSSWPEDAILLNVAAEFNLSETAYVLATSEYTPETPVCELRWFTPTDEVPLVSQPNCRADGSANCPDVLSCSAVTRHSLRHTFCSLPPPLYRSKSARRLSKSSSLAGSRATSSLAVRVIASRSTFQRI